MANKTYSKNELDEMVAEATAAVEMLVKSEVASLKKNDAACQPADAKAAQGGQMTKAGEDLSAPPADASASASAAPAPDASASAPAMDPAAPQDQSAPQGPPSMEELVSAYSQLSPDELKLHMEALQQVAAQSAQPAAPAAPMAPDASMSAPQAGPDAVAPMAGDQSQGVAPEFAQKSEKLEAEVQALKKSLNVAVDALTLVMSAPMVKSITAQDIVLSAGPKVNVQNMAKSEVIERLNKSIRSGKTEKSDGELIKGFFNGTKQVADIAHLLK